MKNSGEERNRDQFLRPSSSGNGSGFGTPYGWTQPTLQDRHPKGSADEAVQPQLGEETYTLNFAHMESPGAKPSTKHRTVEDVNSK